MTIKLSLSERFEFHRSLVIDRRIVKKNWRYAQIISHAKCSAKKVFNSFLNQD